MATVTAKQKAINTATEMGIELKGDETQAAIEALIAAHVPAKNTIIVDEAYMAAHPEIAAQGIKIGDEVEEQEEDPKDPAAPAPSAPAAKPAGKASGDMSIVKGNAYIRTYAADQADHLAEFLAKNPGHEAVPAESIGKIEVPFEEKDPITGVVSRSTKVFTDKAEAILFRNEHRSECLIQGK